MNINSNLVGEIKKLPRDIGDVSMIILKELDKGKKSQTQIEELILEEIRELLVEDGY